jgi:hypothetical protein
MAYPPENRKTSAPTVKSINKNNNVILPAHPMQAARKPHLQKTSFITNGFKLLGLHAAD